jgi:hypothetical protein
MDLYFPYYSFYSSYERVASMGLASLAEISGLDDQISYTTTMGERSEPHLVWYAGM